MDIKFNGAVLQSWRTSLVGVLWFVSSTGLAVAAVATNQPALQFWATIVGSGAGLLLGLLSADHARVVGEFKRLREALDAYKTLAERQTGGGGAAPPVAAGPFSSEPAAPQDTLPEVPALSTDTETPR